MTLTEFLLARIAEDEQVARDGFPDEETSEASGGERVGTWLWGIGQRRALADSEAKRRIVEVCEEGCECHASGTTLGQTDWDLTILRALALPYADHPQFDPDWRV